MKTSKYDGEINEILRVCDETERALGEVSDRALYYVMEHDSLQKILAKGSEVQANFNKIDEHLFPSLFSTLTIALVLSSPTHVAGFLKKYKDELEDNTMSKLTLWKKEPLFWLAFHIEEQYENNLFRVINIFTGEKHLLYSEETKEIISIVKSSLIIYSTVSSNTLCLQTVGEVSYTYLSPQNLGYILSLCSTNNVKPVTKEIVSRVVYRNYFLFSHIEMIRDVPSINVPPYNISYCYSIHRVPIETFSLIVDNKHLSFHHFKKNVWVYQLASVKKSTMKKFLEKYPQANSIFEDMKKLKRGALLIPTLYYDRAKHRILIESMSLEGYQLMRLFIESIIPLDVGSSILTGFEPAIQHPSLLDSCDVTLLHINLFKVLYDFFPHKKLPMLFIKEFKETKKGKAKGNTLLDSLDDKTIDAFNFICESVALSFYDGQIVDITHLADLVDIPFDSVKEIYSSMHESLMDGIEHPIYKLVYENRLDNIGVFTPSFRQLLRVPLRNNSLFSIASKESVTLKSDLLAVFSIEKEGDVDFVDAIETLADIFFSQTTSPIILNSILFILCKNIGKWVGVHALFLKIISSFEHALKVDYDGPDDLIQDFLEFLSLGLETVDLIEMKGKGDVKQEIRATELFSLLISLV